MSQKRGGVNESRGVEDEIGEGVNESREWKRGGVGEKKGTGGLTKSKRGKEGKRENVE